VNKIFRITAANRDQVLPRIESFLKACDVDAAVTIKEYKATRSGQQNRRLHKIIGMCAKEAGYTIEEMKLTFKTELLEPLEILKIKGYRVPVYKSTAQMKVAELNQFMEGVENLAALWYSVVLPAEI